MAIPAQRLCGNYIFCHSVQAKRDTESRKIDQFWIPAFAGMTAFIALLAIATQSRRRESSNLNIIWIPAFARNDKGDQEKFYEFFKTDSNRKEKFFIFHSTDLK